VKVLISDIESRKGLDVVNIIESKNGFDSILCSARNYRFQLPLIYLKKVYPLRTSSYEEFESDLISIQKSFSDELIIFLPVSEKTTRLFYHFVDTHDENNIAFLLPPKELFDLTSDKGMFQAYCENKEFPVPRSYTKKDIFSPELKFRPLVAKPFSGQGSVGLKYINNESELQILDDIDFDNYLIQDKIISNQQVSGAFFLCDQGKLISQYTHQRLRTFPVEGGVTVYSKRTNNDVIVQIGASLLKDLNWTGLAMIEFLYDESSKQWKIIELNPRIWGSILLSAFADADLLRDYVHLCQGKEISQPENRSFREVFIRWLFPFDILNLLKRSISLKEFMSFNVAKTCYINFTYSSFWRSLSYLFYFTFNLRSLNRYIKKLFG